jgi:hypothetical protein
MKIEGNVVRQRVNAGSKSEHDALVLQSALGDFRLQRAGGNPFWDDQLAGLEGKRIAVEGTVRDNVLILSSWSVLGSP